MQRTQQLHITTAESTAESGKSTQGCVGYACCITVKAKSNVGSAVSVIVDMNRTCVQPTGAGAGTRRILAGLCKAAQAPC